MSRIRRTAVTTLLLALAIAGTILIPPGGTETNAAGEYRLALPMVTRDVGPGDENWAAAAALVGAGAVPGGFVAVAAAEAGINVFNPIPGVCPVNIATGMTGAAAAVYAKTFPPEALAVAVAIYDSPAAAQSAAQLLAGTLDCFASQAVGASIQGLVIRSVSKAPLDLSSVPGFAAGARLVAQTGTIIPVGVTLDAVYVVSGRYVFAMVRAAVGTTFPEGETIALAQAGAGLLPPQ
ncbi:MAG: hypothetical protein IT303_03625 [Dehalococcoidia bacterium]|nr:hypothetical protein [Dehalococcoidia bacterium]